MDGVTASPTDTEFKKQRRLKDYKGALKQLLSNPVVKEVIEARKQADKKGIPGALAALNQTDEMYASLPMTAPLPLTLFDSGQDDAKKILKVLTGICALRDTFEALQTLAQDPGSHSGDPTKQLPRLFEEFVICQDNSISTKKLLKHEKREAKPQEENEENPWLKSICHGPECRARNEGVYSDHQKPIDANWSVADTSLTDCTGKTWRLFSLPINMPTQQPNGFTALLHLPPLCDCKGHYWNEARGKIALVRDNSVCSTMSITNCGLIHGAKAVIMFPDDFAKLEHTQLEKRGVQYFEHNGQHLPLGLVTPMDGERLIGIFHGKTPCNFTMNIKSLAQAEIQERALIDTKTFNRLKDISSETIYRNAPKHHNSTESRAKLDEARKIRLESKPKRVL
ncbi:hypothetical protein CDD80_6054 [Ophiocordyceps camponoti-rufipedis]|uniref:Uncharacterized protein n=1 Tax=Ophiocordyceps camponoti-rufipedis TaxID=2004952 RepID=A0A2C5YLI4_9HYPO|nr:hypothetical protein CDD80_6054 [Ophiocordyceps camponoti-rufipedis]